MCSNERKSCLPLGPTCTRTPTTSLKWSRPGWGRSKPCVGSDLPQTSDFSCEVHYDDLSTSRDALMGLMVFGCCSTVRNWWTSRLGGKGGVWRAQCCRVRRSRTAGRWTLLYGIDELQPGVDRRGSQRVWAPTCVTKSVLNCSHTRRTISPSNSLESSDLKVTKRRICFRLSSSDGLPLTFLVTSAVGASISSTLSSSKKARVSSSAQTSLTLTFTAVRSHSWIL